MIDAPKKGEDILICAHIGDAVELEHVHWFWSDPPAVVQIKEETFRVVWSCFCTECWQAGKPDEMAHALATLQDDLEFNPGKLPS